MIHFALMVLLAFSAPTTAPSTQPATMPIAYTVTAVKGPAQFRLAGPNEWQWLKPSVVLHVGDSIRTALRSEVKMKRPDGSDFIWKRLGTWEIGKENNPPTTQQSAPDTHQA